MSVGSACASYTSDTGASGHERIGGHRVEARFLSVARVEEVVVIVFIAISSPSQE